MIEKVWREQVGGINMICTTKLTDEYFNKNAHSRMRVHLSVQVLSLSVFEMLKSYCKDNAERISQYSSLMLIIEKLNTVIDIWNHPSSKTYKCEPNGERYKPIHTKDHQYIKYLEEVLCIFTDWYNESKVSKKPYEFIPKTLYD